MFTDQTLFIILKKKILKKNIRGEILLKNKDNYRKNKPTFYDSDCLASFLIVNEHSILQKMFSKIIIPSPVHNELLNENTPNIIKDNLKTLVDLDFVEVKDIDILSPEFYKYKLIEKGSWTDGMHMGKGEASVIACAIENNGIIASNNLSDIKDLAHKHEIPILTSSIILAKAFEKNMIDKERANDIWEKMLEKKIMLPNTSFSNYYELKYNDDLNNLLKSKEDFI
jgi:predicted nucleic acid-binding protein